MFYLIFFHEFFIKATDSAAYTIPITLTFNEPALDKYVSDSIEISNVVENRLSSSHMDPQFITDTNVDYWNAMLGIHVPSDLKRSTGSGSRVRDVVGINKPNILKHTNDNPFTQVDLSFNAMIPPSKPGDFDHGSNKYGKMGRKQTSGITDLTPDDESHNELLKLLNLNHEHPMNQKLRLEKSQILLRKIKTIQESINILTDFIGVRVSLRAHLRNTQDKNICKHGLTRKALEDLSEDPKAKFKDLFTKAHENAQSPDHIMNEHRKLIDSTIYENEIRIFGCYNDGDIQNKKNEERYLQKYQNLFKNSENGYSLEQQSQFPQSNSKDHKPPDKESSQGLFPVRKGPASDSVSLFLKNQKKKSLKEVQDTVAQSVESDVAQQQDNASFYQQNPTEISSSDPNTPPPIKPSKSRQKGKKRKDYNFDDYMDRMKNIDRNRNKQLLQTGVDFNNLRTKKTQNKQDLQDMIQSHNNDVFQQAVQDRKIMDSLDKSVFESTDGRVNLRVNYEPPIPYGTPLIPFNYQLSQNSFLSPSSQLPYDPLLSPSPQLSYDPLIPMYNQQYITYPYPQYFEYETDPNDVSLYYIDQNKPLTQDQAFRLNSTLFDANIKEIVQNQQQSQIRRQKVKDAFYPATAYNEGFDKHIIIERVDRCRLKAAVLFYGDIPTFERDLRNVILRVMNGGNAKGNIDKVIVQGILQYVHDCIRTNAENDIEQTNMFLDKHTGPTRCHFD